jgi:NAD(P)-dependent dehydrogenase (short-subunit alcohol dehydrogenase family)
MGLMGFAKTVSRELGGYNIRVNAIAPGAAGGDRIERVLQGRATAQHKTLGEERAAALSIQSLKRFVDPKLSLSQIPSAWREGPNRAMNSGCSSS